MSRMITRVIKVLDNDLIVPIAIVLGRVSEPDSSEYYLCYYVSPVIYGNPYCSFVFAKISTMINT